MREGHFFHLVAGINTRDIEFSDPNYREETLEVHDIRSFRFSMIGPLNLCFSGNEQLSGCYKRKQMRCSVSFDILVDGTAFQRREASRLVSIRSNWDGT